MQHPTTSAAKLPVDTTIAMFAAKGGEGPANDHISPALKDDETALRPAVVAHAYLAGGDDDDDELAPVFRACAMAAVAAQPGRLGYGVRSVVAGADRILPLVRHYATGDAAALNLLAELGDPDAKRAFADRMAIWNDPEVRQELADAFVVWEVAQRAGEMKTAEQVAGMSVEEAGAEMADHLLRILQGREG